MTNRPMTYLEEDYKTLFQAHLALKAQNAALVEALDELSRMADKANIPLVNAHAVREMGKFSASAFRVRTGQ